MFPITWNKLVGWLDLINLTSQIQDSAISTSFLLNTYLLPEKKCKKNIGSKSNLSFPCF